MAEKLEVGIGLRDNLTRALKKTTAGIKRFTSGAIASFKSLGRSIFSVKGLIVGLGAAVAVRSISRLVTETAKLDDQIGKLSQRLGVTTEFLSQLKFAGEQSGIGFSALSVGFQRAIRRFEEFRATGKGVAAEAIQALGNGIEDLVRRGATFEELLPRIADGFKNLGSDAERVRTAFKLFDTEGVALVQLLGLGSEEVRKLREEADRLGLTLDFRGAQKAAEFNDAVNRLKASFQGLGASIARDVTPAITELLNQFSNLVTENRDEIVKFFRDLQPEIRAIGLRVKEAAAQVELLFKAFKLLQQLSGAGPAFEAARAAREAILNAERIRAIRRAAGRPDDVIPADVGREERVEAIRRKVFERTFAPAAPPQVAGLAGAAAGATPATVERTSEAVRGLGAALQRVRERATVFRVMEEGALRLATSLESRLTDGISGVRDAFKNMAASVISDITRIITRMLVLRALGGVAGFLLPAPAVPQITGGAGALTGATAGGAGSVSGATAGIPQAQAGGVFSGPDSGFLAMLHGTEEVRQVRRGALAKPDNRFEINFFVQAEDAASFDRKFEQAFAARRELVGNIAISEVRRRPQLQRAAGL